MNLASRGSLSIYNKKANRIKLINELGYYERFAEEKLSSSLRANRETTGLQVWVRQGPGSSGLGPQVRGSAGLGRRYVSPGKVPRSGSIQTDSAPPSRTSPPYT